MKPARSLSLLLALGVLTATRGLAAPAPQGVESRVLMNTEWAVGWQAVESTLTPAPGGRLFRVPVDWKTGEVNYPIGWPRLEYTVPEGEGDWRRWEEVRVRLLPRSSAGSFPFRPLGMTLRSGERGGWEKEVPVLRAGEWQEVSFDLRDLAFPDRVRGMGLFISEDMYADGTVLEFLIARVELARHLAPVLLEMQPVSGLGFAGTKSLAIRVKLAGVAPGRSAPVALTLARGAKTVAARRSMGAAGEQQLFLPLPARLPPGDYRVSATVGTSTRSATLRLLASPWQERQP